MTQTLPSQKTPLVKWRACNRIVIEVETLTKSRVLFQPKPLVGGPKLSAGYQVSILKIGPPQGGSRICLGCNEQH